MIPVQGSTNFHADCAQKKRGLNKCNHPPELHRSRIADSVAASVTSACLSVDFDSFADWVKNRANLWGFPLAKDASLPLDELVLVEPYFGSYIDQGKIGERYELRAQAIGSARCYFVPLARLMLR